MRELVAKPDSHEVTSAKKVKNGALILVLCSFHAFPAGRIRLAD